ncbi:Rossmann fold domain-containing protein [Specibacter sp. RAF43]|uniref:Rossmann fold domain-containing protein n=1 Tax=Specibacter sp. RAF43 TaxID=3233057 RepID=UPI003F9C2BC0
MTRTTALAVELAPHVRVNPVSPAVVKTRFAAAAAFLVSADSSWITGQILDVDGGLLAAGGTA